MPIADVIKECRSRMDKSLEYFDRELRGVRTGRASTALIEYIKVDYYGSSTDLRDLAAINVAEATQLVVKPYDPGSKQEIVKALESSDLGLNPQIDGDTIRIHLPAPSAERRQQLVAQVRKMAEDSRVALRNERRDAIKKVDTIAKDKGNEVSEDDGKHAREEIETLTKNHSAKIDSMTEAKAAEVEEL